MENLLLTVLTAVLCENFVLDQLFGTETIADFSVSGMLCRNLLTAAGMIGASVLSFAAAGVLNPLGYGYLQTAVFAVLLAAVEILASFLTGHKSPGDGSARSHTRIFLNTAVFAVILLAADCGSLYESAVFGVISRLGLVLATLFIASIRGKLETSEIPEAFRGIPVLLISAGICAVILTGFSGLSF